MSFKEDHELLDRLWDKTEITAHVCEVLTGASDEVVEALLKDDSAEAGRIIAAAMESVFADLADGERDTTTLTRAQIDGELKEEFKNGEMRGAA